MSTKAIAISSASSAILTAALIFPFIPSPGDALELPDSQGQSPEALASKLDADQAERKALSSRVDALLERLEAVEAQVLQRRKRDMRAETTTQAAGSAVGVQAVASSPKEASAKKKLTAKEFKRLTGLVLSSVSDKSASTEEQARFWEAARNTTLVDDSISSLESELAGSPRNTDLRMELGNAYVAKLLTVPAGPERAIWGMKAEKQWQKVVDQDPDHWEAQYTIAYGHSMYPEFLNKTDTAIKGFERAVDTGTVALSREPGDQGRAAKPAGQVALSPNSLTNTGADSWTVPLPEAISTSSRTSSKKAVSASTPIRSTVCTGGSSS